MSDAGRLEHAGGELVKHRLKGVVVVLVDEHNLRVGLAKLLCRADAGEAATEDQNPRAPTRGHGVAWSPLLRFDLSSDTDPPVGASCLARS